MDVKESLLLRRSESDIPAAKRLRNAHDLPEQTDTSALLHATDDVVRLVFERNELFKIAAISGRMPSVAAVDRRHAGGIVLRGPLRQHDVGGGAIGILFLKNLGAH